MKKIYLQPTIKVVELKRRQHLLAGSQDAPLSGTQSNKDALSREMDDWDFDDEDY